jgi:hypothetical protein
MTAVGTDPGTNRDGVLYSDVFLRSLVLWTPGAIPLSLSSVAMDGNARSLLGGSEQTRGVIRAFETPAAPILATSPRLNDGFGSAVAFDGDATGGVLAVLAPGNAAMGLPVNGSVTAYRTTTQTYYDPQRGSALADAGVSYAATTTLGSGLAVVASPLSSFVVAAGDPARREEFQMLQFTGASLSLLHSELTPQLSTTTRLRPVAAGLINGLMTVFVGDPLFNEVRCHRFDPANPGLRTLCPALQLDGGNALFGSSLSLGKTPDGGALLVIGAPGYANGSGAYFLATPRPAGGCSTTICPAGSFCDPGTQQCIQSPPVVVVAEPTRGPAPLSVKALLDPPVLGSSVVSWDLGNGATKTGSVIQTVYPFPGRYTLQATVRLGTALVGSDSVTIEVEPLDSGISPDASIATDAGSLDAGSSRDAGVNEPQLDAGSAVDSGTDAGGQPDPKEQTELEDGGFVDSSFEPAGCGCGTTEPLVWVGLCVVVASSRRLRQRAR